MIELKEGVRLLILLVVLLLLIGVGGLYASARLHEDTIVYHLIRDLSLAFVVSALVTAAYEIYIRRRVDLEKIGSVLSTVAGSSVPPNVWEDIKRTLLTRNVIRRHAEVRLSLRPVAGAQSLYALDYEFSYDLASLLLRPTTTTVRHGLDEHIVDPSSGLPRFESLAVGKQAYTIGQSTNWESADKAARVIDGRLTFDVELQPNPADGIPISVRRSEVRACPGSYFLLMTELTDGIRLYLDTTPAGVNLTVIIRPEEDEVSLTATSPLFTTSSVLLPGHGIELKLKT